MKQAIQIILLLVVCINVSAQVDTSSYPKERNEIRALMHSRQSDIGIDCKDYIAVGPKGDISFSHQQWLEAQRKEKLVFKSVTVVPGNDFIRIYDGKTAVVNFLAEVKLVVAGKDISLMVRRLEVFIKSDNNWCRVAGQGTEVDEKLFPVR